MPALVCFELVALSVSSEDLIVRRAADQIHVTAPRLHFLVGKSLQRLHDGATVPFDFQLTIAAGTRTNVVQRNFARFMVSYDLWEEKFRVVRLANSRLSKSNLSANAAEAWCLDNLILSASQLPADRELWARLEVRTGEPKDQNSGLSDPGISIATLIELFSRPPHLQQEHWAYESGPFHLADLKP